jgi:hypothetical protein
MTDDDSLLFPRLPKAVAERVYERLVDLPLTVVSNEWATSHPDAVIAPIGGTEVAEPELAELRNEIVAAAHEAGFPDQSNDKHRAAFDLCAAEILTSKMTIVPAEAIEPDVWAFLGVVLLPDVTFWRFENRPIDRILGTDLTRHAFARLWWRAYQLRDLRPGDGLAGLARIPESAMNQLFERRNIGGNRILVRALGRVLTAPDSAWQETADRALLRDAVKRVQRLLPFVAFESFEDADLETFVRDLFTEAAAQLSGGEGGQTTAPPVGEAAHAHNGDRSDGRTAASAPYPAHLLAPSISKGLKALNAERTQAGEQPLTMIAYRAQYADRRTEAQEWLKGRIDEKAWPAQPQPAGTPFDELPLAAVPVQIADLVNALGGLGVGDLERMFAEHYGVPLSHTDSDILGRFAWSARGRGFISQDEENDLWLPGTKPATPIEEFGDWTFKSIRSRALSMLSAAPKDDPYQRLLAEVCPSEKPPLLVRRIVGKAVAAARMEKRHGSLA